MLLFSNSFSNMCEAHNVLFFFVRGHQVRSSSWTHYLRLDVLNLLTMACHDPTFACCCCLLVRLWKAESPATVVLSLELVPFLGKGLGPRWITRGYHSGPPQCVNYVRSSYIHILLLHTLYLLQLYNSLYIRILFLGNLTMPERKWKTHERSREKETETEKKRKREIDAKLERLQALLKLVILVDSFHFFCSYMYNDVYNS